MTKDAESIEEKYERAMKDAISVNPAFSYQAKAQMAAMVEEIARSNENFATFLKWENSPERLGGFLAEEFHSTTFNMDSILKDRSFRAETGMDNNVIDNNNTQVDIAVADVGNILKTAQSKFMGDAGTTAKSHSTLNKDTLAPKYGNADIALSPSDQTAAVRKSALDNAARHERQAEQLAQSGGSPEVIRAHKAQAEAYRQTAGKVSDTVKHEDVTSTPLSKSEANALGKGDLKKLDEVRSDYQTRSTLQQMGKAAAGAAAMTAVVAGTVNSLRYLDLARQGKISSSEAVVKIVAETTAAAADSAVKASLITGANSTIIRVTSQTTTQLAKQGLKTMMRANAVSVGVVCAVNAVKDLVLLARGEITEEMFYERQGKGFLNTGAGTMGASLGAAIMPAIGGAVVLPALVGGLVGGVVASVAMDFAIEAGVEAPYQDLVSNATLLNESARLLTEVSQQIFDAQVNFERFLLADAALDEAFRKQTAAGAASADRMRLAIDKI